MIDRITYSSVQYKPGANLSWGMPAAQGTLRANQVASDAGTEKASGSRRSQLSQGKCETCSERRYQDGSNDPGVSFKAPTRISPENAGAAVAAHEGEHVQRERAKAQVENKEVIAQSVRIYNAICPECGKSYVAGGETTTTTRTTPASSSPKSYGSGQNVDVYA